MKDTNVKFLPGRGLDVGTGFLVAARMTEPGDIVTKSVRDSFLEVRPPNKLVYGTMKKGLLKAGVNFFEADEVFNILGDDSLIQSVERQLVLQRPMSRGVISPLEAKALPMFKALLRELLGEPLVPNEQVVYSIPAAPADAPFDVKYHESVIESILASLGFSGKSLNEAYSIVLSELGEDGDDYTGVTISMGSGMCNVAISNMAELLHSFAISKGGDYIDFSSATSLGFDPKNPKLSEVTPSLVTYIKEQGVDINNPKSEDRIEIAIAAHYKALINYLVDNLILEFNKLESKPKFIAPVKVLVSGGTAKAIGFLDAFKVALSNKEGKLPFKIKTVVLANHPLTAVAEGCLLALMSEVE